MFNILFSIWHKKLLRRWGYIYKYTWIQNIVCSTSDTLKKIYFQNDNQGRQAITTGLLYYHFIDWESRGSILMKLNDHFELVLFLHEKERFLWPGGMLKCKFFKFSDSINSMPPNTNITYYSLWALWVE